MNHQQVCVSGVEWVGGVVGSVEWVDIWGVWQCVLIFCHKVW